MEAIRIQNGLTQWQMDNVEKVFNQESSRLLGFIRRRVRSQEEAEDILQDVFFQLIEAYESIEDLEKTTSWLFRVARNKIIDRYRKKKPDTFSDHDFSTDEGGDTIRLADIIPDLEGTPDEWFTNEILWDAIMEALNELPEEQKNVFVWHEFDDMSFREIAEMTGESINTLLSRKRYAILHLRRTLREFYEEL